MKMEKFTREEIESELQEKALGDFKSKDFKVVVDYYLDKINNERSKELYKKIIEENSKEFSEKLKEINGKIDGKSNEITEKAEIDTLISFLSLTPLNIAEVITECPILKSIRAIPSIKTVFAPYTDESEKLFAPLKDHLNKMGIKLIGEHVDIDDIQDSYNSLLGFIKAEGLDGSNTIIDSTSGLRMFGMALYKVAVERGLNLITWRDYQLPLYEKDKENLYIKSKNKNDRIPFLAKLVVIPEPKFENAKIHRALNEELRDFNLSGAKNYYNTLGITDLKKLCQELEKVFNLENILELNSENFYQSLDTTLKNILSIDLEEERNSETIKMILLKLLPIVDYKKILDGINSFNLKKEDIDDYIITASSKDKNLKEKIYYSFVLKYLMAKLENNNLDNFIVQNIIKKVSKFNKTKEEFKSLEDIFNLLFIDKDLEIKDKLEDISSIFDNLVDEGEPLIELDKNILKLLKYNLTIDLLEKEKEKVTKADTKDSNYLFTTKSVTGNKIQYDSKAIPLVRLIKEDVDYLDNTTLKKIYGEKNKKGELSNNTFSKNKTELKKIIKFINDTINEELEKTGKEKNDFIIITYEVNNNLKGKNKEEKKKIKTIEINSFFKEV
ncbi:MAG: hypothetical protein SOR11_06670 [Fusobacterium sp.]|uniref:hypothetical protein n=1 Tax=Fusobacterium sp. TaxID=68766 RepID=UPI0029426B8F|nr:hypothetical protein [Fusobacterium sp.]MDY3059663.1 hypothetical protein [Fusobacterium sp.]MEE1476726.1 hypothetical protein [Fusobacterium sp.]